MNSYLCFFSKVNTQLENVIESIRKRESSEINFNVEKKKFETIKNLGILDKRESDIVRKRINLKILDRKSKESLLSSINRKWISPLETYMALSPNSKRDNDREPYTYETSKSEDEYEGNTSRFQNKVCKSSMLTIVKNFNYLMGKADDFKTERR